MSILVVSASHHGAGVDALNALALDTAGVVKMAHALTAHEQVEEVVVLSTCNRTEVYVQVGRFHAGLEAVVAELSAGSSLSGAELQQICRVYYDEAAVGHLFTVAAGLDSMVVGESQILGQVRQALTASQQAGTVGSALNSLFQQALRVGKRVQHETSVGSAGRSLVSAAVDALSGQGLPLAGRTVVVLGAGSIASLAAHTVAAEGAGVVVVNRTLSKAQRLADQVEGRAFPLEELDRALAGADVLVSCVGAPGYVVVPEQVSVTPLRAVVDLAMPADVDPRVGDLLTLVNLETLRAGQVDTATVDEVQAATELVAGEVSDFLGARRAATVTPTVVALRTMAAEVVSAEMARLTGKVPDLGAEQLHEVERTVRRVVDKILHQPTVRLQAHAATEGATDYADALRELFALDPVQVSAVSRLGDVPRGVGAAG
ncbi:glutamyl-tRNA reductase [Auraticoccus monumenti]|uniref:Glutamyl-tRNA reductase n=1 Tax=Auraticoccus monumenti TaxID=675864 RepID=A0A1G6RKI1_9ACTN|nr:glutamyl-tRNA reductase [Auraticoccus monumenti]SDD04903.1 glutamyl-tRNA reductase [Auraticoccus monumenti]